MATKAIVGEKVGMTQIWDDQNRAIPVTLVRVVPCRVVQVKTPESDGYSAVQVTFGAQRPSRLNKPEQGHFAKAGVEPGKRLVELRVDDAGQYSVGDEINATILSAGEKVDVTGVSKGTGVIWRGDQDYTVVAFDDPSADTRTARPPSSRRT